MNTIRVSALRFWLCLLLTPLAVSVCLAQSTPSQTGRPVVRKLDPPNWWTNFTPELTLLVTGENLGGARVESATKGLTVAGSEASANGHYLFVRLKFGSGLRAGNAVLWLRTAAGETTLQLPVFARNDAPSDFQGFSRDDVIYLIMPDRFADGDVSNDQPA